MLAVFKELYYASNDQKMADKKKANYQEGLEKSHADSTAWSRDSYMKDPEKIRARSHKSYIKNPERVMLTVQHEAAKVIRTTWRRVMMIVLQGAMRVTWRTLRNVMHETAKITWRIRKRVILTVQHETAKVNKKDLEESHWNETGLAISYKS